MTSTAKSSLIRVLALATAYLAVWLAARPYEGIAHDAQVYVLQALAYLHPESLGGDLFLRFGSQNDFTVFPRIVAALIERLGVEQAALLVTVCAGASLLVLGWLLARQLSSARTAWLVVGLLVTIPGWYGAGDVFRFDEMYLNARVPCEVLCIGALLAIGARRWWLGLLLLFAAATVHPMMTVPAIGSLVLLWIDGSFGREHPRLGTWIAVGGAVALCLALWMFAPDSSGPDRAAWVETLQSRNPFLFLRHWRLEDWLQNTLGLATLAIAANVLEEPRARRLAWYVALIGALGIFLAAIATQSDRLDLLLIAQPWRWSWLGRFVAIVLLPAVVAGLWRASPLGRAVALIVASGWVLHGYFGGALVALAALLWFTRERLGPGVVTTLRPLAWVVATAAAVIVLTMTAQALPLPLDTHLGPGWAQRVVNVAGLAGPAILVITACWYVAYFSRSLASVVALGAMALIALIGTMEYNLARIGDSQYSEARRGAFATWRALIPPSAEVLWHDDPVAAWVMLERKSYLSGSQLAGLLYSREGIREFDRRRQALAPLANPDWWRLAALDKADEPRELTAGILQQICLDPALGFVVDRRALGSEIARGEWPTHGRYVYLYDCSARRREPRAR